MDVICQQESDTSAKGAAPIYERAAPTTKMGYNCQEQTCVKIPQDLGFWIPSIQDPGSLRILDLTFSFSRGILEILDPVTATLLWDLRDLRSQTEKSYWIQGILDPDWAGCHGTLRILVCAQQ